MSDQPAKRSEYVRVHRHLLTVGVLIVAANLVDDLTAWTGWSILAVLATSARIVTVGYAILWFARPSVKGSIRREEEEV